MRTMGVTRWRDSWRERSSGRVALVFAGLLLGAAAMGCVPDFEPASRLGEEPRVVAIRSEPPETSTGGGGGALLEAALYEPAGPLYLAWIACYGDPRGWSQTCAADALAGGAELLPCDGVSQVPVCVASTDATAFVPVPAWVAPEIPDEEGVPVESVVHVTLVASVEPDPLTACGAALAEVKPTEACLLGEKRLLVSVRPEADRNLNPVVAELLVDGVAADPAVPVMRAGASGEELEVGLGVSIEPLSVTDEVVDADGNPDEAFLELRWYAGCGGLTRASARVRCEPLPDAVPGDPPVCEVEETLWRPRTSGSCTVYAVVSDGHGGVGFWSQPFEIQP